MVSGDNDGILNGTQVALPIQVPVNVCGTGVGALLGLGAGSARVLERRGVGRQRRRRGRQRRRQRRLGLPPPESAKKEFLPVAGGLTSGLPVVGGSGLPALGGNFAQGSQMNLAGIDPTSFLAGLPTAEHLPDAACRADRAPELGIARARPAADQRSYDGSRSAPHPADGGLPRAGGGPVRCRVGCGTLTIVQVRWRRGRRGARRRGARAARQAGARPAARRSTTRPTPPRASSSPASGSPSWSTRARSSRTASTPTRSPTGCRPTA